MLCRTTPKDNAYVRVHLMNGHAIEGCRATGPLQLSWRTVIRFWIRTCLSPDGFAPNHTIEVKHLLGSNLTAFFERVEQMSISPRCAIQNMKQELPVTLHITSTHNLRITAKRRSSLFDTVQHTYTPMALFPTIYPTTLFFLSLINPIPSSLSLPPPNPPPYIQRTRNPLQSQRVQRRVTHFFFRQWRKRLV